MISCPVKKTQWGPITTKAAFIALLRTYGQFYGVDQSGPACNYDPSYPCDKSLYEYKGWGPHKGIDIPVLEGTELFAGHDWECVRVSETTSQGLGIVLKHQDINLETLYWHNSDNLVKVKQKGKKGDLIGLSGNTGFSSGPHLHFETRNIDSVGKFVSYADPLDHISFDDMLTKDNVRFLQALEGFHDEAGVDFWGDGTHTLEQYKAARVPDKIKELTDLK